MEFCLIQANATSSLTLPSFVGGLLIFYTLSSCFSSFGGKHWPKQVLLHSHSNVALSHEKKTADSVSYFHWAKLTNFIEKDKRAEDYGDFKVRSKHFFLYIRCGQRPASHWKQLQLTYVSDSSKAGAVSAAQVAGLCFCFPNIAERREREIRWICWSFREHFNQNCSCLQGLEVSPPKIV